jgi:hypothetical protein
MWPKSRLARKLRGAGNRGEAESTRIQLLKECVERANIANTAAMLPSTCTSTHVETITQRPPELRWNQSIPIARPNSTYSIAVDPSQNVYCIFVSGSSLNNSFTILSYDENQIFRASITETPPPTDTNWTHNDLVILWDTFSSHLFVAELVTYFFPITKIVRVFKFDLNLNLISVTPQIGSVSQFDRSLSLVSNQQGRLVLYMQYNGRYVYDTNLNLDSGPFAPSLTISSFGESGPDSLGNSIFSINSFLNSISTYYFTIQSVNAAATVLWDISFNYIPSSGTLNPCSLLLSPDKIRFFYSTGTTLVLQTLTYSGTPLASSIILNVTPNAIEGISTAQNINGRIFLFVDTGLATDTLYELDSSGTILFSTLISGTNRYIRAIRCDNQYLWSVNAGTMFNIRQFLLEIQNSGNITVCTCKCPQLSQPIIQQPTTPNQLSFILDQAVSCPILYVTPTATFGCQPVYTEPIPPLTGPGVEPPQGPAVTDVYRQFSRIGGIDQISKPLVGRSSNDRTARLRAGIVSQSQTRYVQTILPIVPYPPCLPPRVGPAAGVPIAPNNACNLGTRRVDFSNPKA